MAPAYVLIQVLHQVSNSGTRRAMMMMVVVVVMLLLLIVVVLLLLVLKVVDHQQNIPVDRERWHTL